jgi:hypothetical protein
MKNITHPKSACKLLFKKWTVQQNGTLMLYRCKINNPDYYERY